MIEKNIIDYIELCIKDKPNRENATYYIWEIENLTVQDYLSALLFKKDIENIAEFFKHNYELEFDNFRRSIQIKVKK
jgi:RIO-like serine/threonine protein kinase